MSTSAARRERTCLLVRHAQALSRQRWSTDDAERPLSPRGDRQAKQIAARLASADVELVLSSPARRCVTTVAGLAGAVGRQVEVADYLAEGVDGAVALKLVIEASAALDDGATLVACSHGDVLTGIVAALASTGVLSGTPSVAKGGAIAVRLADGEVTAVNLVDPPDGARSVG